jgi:CAAX prenyl protease-like protein
VFLVIASFYPDFADSEADPDPALADNTQWYLAMVAGQVLIAFSLLFYFRKIYVKHFPLKLSPLSVVVGAIGVVLWIGICELHIERNVFQAMGLDSLASVRPAFNPFDRIPETGLRTLFLVLRFTLLALLVPIVEELFLRGWLVRWVQDPRWETVSLKNLGWMALMTPSLYGVLTHPSEAIAAFLWFGLVTLLMHRTGNLWDCVVAHAVTNLLLGIYVVQFEAWHLW